MLDRLAAILPSDGFCATLEEAKARVAETWRAWLALDVKPPRNSSGGPWRKLIMTSKAEFSYLC